jgi:hypothetical protein
MLRRGTATAIIWLRLRTHSSWRISPAPSAGCRLECPMCAIGFLTLMPPRRGIGGPLAARATKVASQSVSIARNHVLPCTGALRGPSVRIAWPSERPYKSSWSHASPIAASAGLAASSYESEVRLHPHQNTPRLNPNIKITFVSILCYCIMLFSFCWRTHWNDPDAWQTH